MKKVEAKEYIEWAINRNIRWLRKIENKEWDESYIPKIIKRNQRMLKEIEQLQFE